MASAVHDFLNPSGVALFGSMKEEWFFGAGVVIKDLLEMKYPGAIHPIHPSTKSVYGIPVRKGLNEIDGPVDLAVIITSYRQVPAVLKQCGEKGIGSVIVVADGFGENGEEGRLRQEELLAVARSFGIRIMGPNTLGVYNPVDRFTSVPYEKGYGLSPTGPLSIISQTGIYGPQAYPFTDYTFGIRSIIDLGNMCDIDEVDCLEYLLDDPETKVISLYLEHSRRPRKLLEVAREVSRHKPVLCLKGGRSDAAADAMASHTGSMAGNDRLYDALFRHAGVIRVDEYEELLDYAKIMSPGILPKGNRLGIITLTGAIGIQCIDAASASGLIPGRLSQPSRTQLSRISTTLSGHPIDLGPASAIDGPALFNHYMKCYDVLVEDPDIDCIYFNFYIGSYMVPEMYEGVLKHMAENMRKPVVSWAYGPVMDSVRKLSAFIEGYRIPVYSTTFRAIKALGHLVQYASRRNGGS